MPYQDPSTGQWLNDDGSPMYDYLPPGYGDYQAQADTPALPPGAPTPQPTPPPPPPEDNGLGPYPDVSHLGPIDQIGLPGLPGVGPAPAFNFRAPSVDEALNEPGYQFVLNQGNQSLQRWAAARGTLNDSSTAEALTNYGQNAASQQYKNVWDRMFSVAREAYTPQLATWQAQNQRAALGYSTEAEWDQHVNDMNYKSAWDKLNNLQEQYRWQGNFGLDAASR